MLLRVTRGRRQLADGQEDFWVRALRLGSRNLRDLLYTLLMSLNEIPIKASIPQSTHCREDHYLCPAQESSAGKSACHSSLTPEFDPPNLRKKPERKIKTVPTSCALSSTCISTRAPWHVRACTGTHTFNNKCKFLQMNITYPFYLERLKGLIYIMHLI